MGVRTQGNLQARLETNKTDGAYEIRILFLKAIIIPARRISNFTPEQASSVQKGIRVKALLFL